MSPGNISANLRKYRDHWGLSRGDVRARTGIAEKTLYQYERGVRSIPLNAAYRLAKFYNTTVDRLIEDPVNAPIRTSIAQLRIVNENS